MLNRFQFIGNLGNDAEVRQTQTGSSAIGFSVAVSESYTDKQGQKVENTTWVSCTIWKQPNTSVKIAEYLRKGTKVLIEGKPSVRTYQAANGETKAVLEVRVDNVQLLGARPDGQAQPSPVARPAAPVPVQRTNNPFASPGVQNPFADPSAPQEDDLPF
jgi:single-strand DNA-binding protein